MLTGFVSADHLAEVKESLIKASAKSSELDLMPTWLLKKCGDELAPVLLDTISRSLESGVVPDSFKLAHVPPLLKRSGLKTENLKHYRPVSNLFCLSKLTKRVASSRLAEHLTRFDLHDPQQSAYRPLHNCETALTRVQNEILRAMDKRKVGILLLLDVSATSDTVCHDILLRRLESDMGCAWHSTCLAEFLCSQPTPVCQHSWGDVWDVLCPVWRTSGVSTWPTAVLRIHQTASQPHPQSWPRP